MAKQTFNEAETFLLENWEQARAFEDAMASVRQNYRSVAERIIKDAANPPGKFDYCGAYVANDSTEGGSIAFGRRAWVASDDEYVTGLWIGNIGLDSLLSSSSESPWASVSGKRLFASREDSRSVLQRIGPELRQLPLEGVDELDIREGSRSSIIVWNFSSKQELLATLREGESAKFQGIIMKQLENFATMLPVIERFLVRPETTRK